MTPPRPAAAATRNGSPRWTRCAATSGSCAAAGECSPARSPSTERPGRCCLPLATEPVRLERARGAYKVVPAGDLEVTPLVADRGLAARLEQAPGIGTAAWLSAPGTRAWFETVAARPACPPPTMADDDSARPRPPKEGLVLYPRAVLYPARDVYSVGLGDALRAWAARPGVDDSALAAPLRHGRAGEPHRSPMWTIRCSRRCR